MVAGKVKLSMGLQKSSPLSNPNKNSSSSPKQPPPPPTFPSPSSAKPATVPFSRSFGVYFPRASAQVQPRPPDVTELLHLVEQLRERESLLKTQLLEQKLLRESVAILPKLEHEILVKETEIERRGKKIDCLETENERLRQQVETLHANLLQHKREYEQKVFMLQTQISDLSKSLSVVSVSETTHPESSSSSSSSSLSSSFQRFQGLVEFSGKSTLIKSFKKCVNQTTTHENDEQHPLLENTERPRHTRCNSEEMPETSESVMGIRSRAPRVPKPPPRPSFSHPSTPSSSSSSPSYGSFSDSADRALKEIPTLISPNLAPPPPPPPPMLLSKAAPPPPPPPPPKGVKGVAAKVRRVPEVVEFYHSLMRRDSRRESCAGAEAPPAVVAVNARDMIGEIENRSTHLLAIKTDVEMQGDFIRFLIKEVETAAFTDIEDVVPFVKWLDDELSYLVDERAVLKHFNWPEQKADALREAAFGYCDLKKLESEASSFRDNPRQPCATALKKMQALFEKLEHGVYNLSRMRESATKRYKVLRIPMDWMLDTGNVSQIKFATVKLALKYMKRISAELETVIGGCPEEEELIVQGVRFAFRVHQFAGGFDLETMRAFQELREKARSCHIQCQNQNQQKFICRSTAC